MAKQFRHRASELDMDHPRRFLDPDLDEDKYSLEEYGFLVGYYEEDEW